jgi:hypothetical protein
LCLAAYHAALWSIRIAWHQRCMLSACWGTTRHEHRSCRGSIRHCHSSGYAFLGHAAGGKPQDSGLTHGRAVYRQHCNATAGHHQLSTCGVFLTNSSICRPHPCASQAGWHTCGCCACTARFHSTRPSMRTGCLVLVAGDQQTSECSCTSFALFQAGHVTHVVAQSHGCHHFRLHCCGTISFAAVS